MSMDAPAFIYGNKNRSNRQKFVKKNKEDVLATIEFLYKRGMWSKFHYEQWKAEAQSMTDEEMLHLWWDSIVGGAMFEVEPNFEAKKEGMEEEAEDAGKMLASKKLGLAEAANKNRR